MEFFVSTLTAITIFIPFLILATYVHLLFENANIAKSERQIQEKDKEYEKTI